MSKRVTSLLFLLISLLGFLDASYLAIKHYRGEVPPCSIIVGCEIVTTSAYSLIFNIPVALLGSIFYLTIFIATIIYFDTKKKKLLNYISKFTIIGFLASAWFMYAQFFIIKALCIWCIGSATTSTLLFIVGLLYLLKKKKQVELEPVEILDDSGNPTGEIVTRHIAHKNKSLHRIINVWVMNSNGELLLSKRAPTQIYPNLWNTSTVGGHINPGQTSKEASVREVKEEIGLDIKEADLEYLFTCERTRTTRHLIDVYLVQKDISVFELKLDKNEISEVKFFPFKEVEKEIYDQTKYLFATEQHKMFFEILHKRFDAPTSLPS